MNAGKNSTAVSLVSRDDDSRNMRTMWLTQSLFLLMVTLGVVTPENVTVPLGMLRNFALTHLGAAEIVLVTTSLVIIVAIAVSPLGRVRLGEIEAGERRFGTLSWLSMLFASGIGVGLVFWSVAEPLIHATANPFSDMGLSGEYDPVFGVSLTLYHWGIHAWSIYAVVAVSIAVTCYARQQPLRFKSVLEPILGRYAMTGIGDAALAVTYMVIALGVTTTLGLAALAMGKNIGVDSIEGAGLSLCVVAFTSFFCITTKHQRGVRWISLLASSLLISLVLAMIVIGPTAQQITLVVQSLVRYVEVIPSLSIVMPADTGQNWHGQWTLAYWGWWLSFAPFTGVFIARISRGRTVRELILAMLLVPVGASLLFIGIMAGAAFALEPEQRAVLTELSRTDPSAATSHLLGLVAGQDWGFILKTVAVLLMLCLTAQTLNAGIIAMRLLSTGDTCLTRGCALGWTTALCGIAFVLLQAGGTSILQSAAIVGGLLFSGIFVVMLGALICNLIHCRATQRTSYE